MLNLVGGGLANIEHRLARPGAAGRSSQRSSTPLPAGAAMTSPGIRHEEAGQKLRQPLLRRFRWRRPGWQGVWCRWNPCAPELELDGRVAGPATGVLHGELRKTREMLLPPLPPRLRSASGVAKQCAQRQEGRKRSHRMRHPAHRATRRSVEHPERELLNTDRACAGETTPRRSAPPPPHDELVDEDRAPNPGMPRIDDLDLVPAAVPCVLW